MNPAVLAYLPPPKRGHPQVFIDNLRRFDAGVPVLLFSEHPWPVEGLVRLKGDPGAFRDALGKDGRPNPFAIHNAVFFTACRIAQARGISHMMFVEDDCRVGRDGWAVKMFDEAFNGGQPFICAGSMAVYNPCNAGPVAARRWAKLVERNSRRNFPIPTYGWKGAADSHPSCVFVNGALGIYNLAWLAKLFDLEDTASCARLSTAYDMEIGMRVWERFQDRSYDLVGQITCAYSGYGDILTTEPQRLEMLRSGDAVAVHQVKSDQTV